MRQVIKNASEKLAALPKWVKVAMFAQTMMAGTVGFIGLGGVLAVQSDQLAIIVNVMRSLAKDSAAHEPLVRAIALGATDGRMWMLLLFGGLTASVAIGFVIVSMTPWKFGDTPMQPAEQGR